MFKVSFIKQVFKEFGSLKVGQLSAAFSYSAVFSIGPLLLVLITVAGFILGPKAASGALYNNLSGVVGAQTAHTIQNVVLHIHKSKSGPIALIVGGIGLLLGAASITAQLQGSFNHILGAVADSKGGIKRKVRTKLKNIAVVLLASLVVAASVIGSTLVEDFGKRAKHLLGLPPFSLEIANNLVSLVFLALILYLLFRTLADVVVPRKILLGASIIASLLFMIGKIVLAIIIGRNSTASAYGAAASLITLMLWIYYSAEIIYLTAVGIKVYGDDHSVIYKAKKFNLKRQTVTIDAHNVPGNWIEAWLRGFRRQANKKPKKK